MPAANHPWTRIALACGYKDEREMLEDLYTLPPKGLGLTLAEIARKLGYSEFSVRRRIILFGIKVRRPGRRPQL